MLTHYLPMPGILAIYSHHNAANLPQQFKCIYLVNASMYFNYDFGFNLFYISTRYYRELVKLNIREVRQASKSTTGALRRSLEITRWSVNTLTPRKIRL